MSTEENQLPAPEPAAERPSEMEPVVRWSIGARIAFRFAFCYLVLYCLYLADGLLQLLAYIASQRSDFSFDGLTSPFWHAIVPWVGQHVLHLRSAITVFTNGSGDTTYDYVLVFCELAIAAFATILWSIVDRKRPNYRTLHQWLRLLVRLSLASQMFSYGLDKAIPLQFGTLSLNRLIMPVGEMTRFTLLWSFMAASIPYTVFGGLAEILSGVLLLFSRTVIFGALVSFAVLLNVFALNLSYDVPVKLMSFHLVLLSAFLLIPEARRLANVLVLNRVAQPAAYASYSKRRWMNRAAALLPPVWGVLLFLFLLFLNYKTWSSEQRQAADHGPLYGIWQVEQFTSNGTAAVPLFTAKIQHDMQIAPGEDGWQRVLFDNSKVAVLQLKGGVLDWVEASLDQNKGSLSFSDSLDRNWRCTFSYRKASASVLNLQGTVNGAPVSITLRRIDESKYPLTSRGIHWISEHPY
jgi:hypothetical protein